MVSGYTLADVLDDAIGMWRRDLVMTDGMMLLVLPGRMTRIPLWIVAGAAASVAVLLLVLLFVGSYR